MGTKMAVAFAEILKTEILKPLIWKRYIDDIFFLWTLRRGDNAVHWAIKQTNTTPQLNLRLKFQKQKHFWIQTFIKVKDSEAIQFLMCVTLQTYWNISIYALLFVPPQGSKKASSKPKHWDFSEQTLLKTYLKSKFKIQNHTYRGEVVP